MAEGRLVLENRDFRKELMLPEEGCSPRVDLLALHTFDFVPDILTWNGSSGGWRSRHISVDARQGVHDS